jgi:hypothetical protein
VEKGPLIKPEAFRFRPFIQHLVKWLELLNRQFCDTPHRYEQTCPLIEAAGRVQVVENSLRWEEVHSYYNQRSSETPISDLMGLLTLEAVDWSIFLPWLV